MQLDLENKVFLVAGSTQGIGLGIVQAFLTEGACVSITGRDQIKLDRTQEGLSTFHNHTLFVQADMQRFESIQEAVQQTHAKWGRIDGIIANIGSGKEDPNWDENPDIWFESYNKNVQASMFLVQASLPYIKENGGSITFISSIAGVESINAPIAYSMHKATVIAASKKLSRELAQYRIRVNTVAPGNILFEDGGWEKRLQNNKSHTESYIKSEVPMNQFGSVADVGYACVFLASNRAEFITGSTLIVDGGQTRSY